MVTEFEFSNIYNEYYPKIIRYLSKIARPDDAEDMAQDVFEKISRNMRGFKRESKLSTWIYRIATNTAIDRFRSASYKHSMKHRAFDDTAIEDSDSWRSRKPSATDQTVIRKEMSACVQEFIDNLPPNYKIVIALSELEDLTKREIADILEISLDNVKIRLHRARAKLKAALSDGCDFYHNEQNILACDRKSSQILQKPPK